MKNRVGIDFLKGKVINQVLLSEDGQLQFLTESGESCEWNPEGDCCSSSYFVNVRGVKRVLGEIVIDVIVDDPGPNNWVEPASDGCEKFYWYRVATTGGDLLVLMQNSSNGYYGGWVEMTSGNYLRNVKPLNKDWSCG